MPSAVFKSTFDAEVVRHKADKTTFTFKTPVQGQFESKGGKPIFTIVAITVEGMPEMSLSSFLPAELTRVKEYALEEVYPRLLGIKK